MKYENLERVNEIARELDSLEEILRALENENASGFDVIIEHPIQGQILAIGTESDSGGPYAEKARVLLDEIKADLKIRIQKLKDELSEL